jgi:hypothetical protein
MLRAILSISLITLGSTAFAQPIEVPLNKELIIRGAAFRFMTKANDPGGRSCAITCNQGEQIWFMECNNRRPPEGENFEIVPKYKGNGGMCESKGEMGDSCRALCVTQ